jgi:hypothetical protein
MICYWQFRQVVEKDFAKENSWPQLVPQLKLVIQSSNAISPGHHPEWKTINALTVLQSIVRPFQVYFSFQGLKLHAFACTWIHLACF